MIEKIKDRQAFLSVCFICVILLAFTVADLVTPDRLFSETENRILAAKPEYSRESLLDGSFTKDYDTYVTDQFIGRDKWISIKTGTDILMQKKEINGVYLGADHYLIEQHLEEDYPQELVEQRLDLLEKLVDRWGAKVMLAPTADNILTDKLPAYAEVYDQRALLEAVKERIGEEQYIDVYSALQERKDEDIYYRTDHHWTSRGAYYGYCAWANAMKKRIKVDSADSAVPVSENFLGTLHSKLNIKIEPDTIAYFPVTEKMPVRLTYDMQTEKESFYEESYLNTKNQYGYFLDDNHAFIEIETSCRNGKTLFVIKDSYANCLIPLLALNYEKVYVIDLRYMNGRLFPFMEGYEPEQGMDVLVVYNCVHFLEEFQYY